MTTALTLLAIAFAATAINLRAQRLSPQVSLEQFRTLQAFKQ